MITVNSQDLWSELEKLAKKTACIKAAVAYVSDDSNISFGKGDILVVDASVASIAGGRTSAAVLKNAHQNGAKLYSCDTLHGKIIVFDHHAYIGSANISRSSKETLDEIGVITDHPNIMSGAIQLIDKLAHQSTVIDKEFIESILKIDVKHSDIHGKKPRKISIGKPCTWLVSLRNDADYPGDASKIEKENESVETAEHEKPAWFFLRKGCRFYDKAKIGDSIVIIEREKLTSKEPKKAYRHVTIKNITVDEAINTKSYHYAYTKEFTVTWPKFKKLAEKAGVSRLGSGLNTARELSEKRSNTLFELWSA